MSFAAMTVAVTGAAGGIGQALCRLFGGEGARIAAIDRHPSVCDFAAGLAFDLIGQYPLLQAIEISGRAHSLLVRLRRIEERATLMGTGDVA